VCDWRGESLLGRFFYLGHFLIPFLAPCGPGAAAKALDTPITTFITTLMSASLIAGPIGATLAMGGDGVGPRQLVEIAGCGLIFEPREAA
jgi:hypothetical protein